MSSTTNADEASVDLIENFKSIQAKIEAATQALKENSSKKPQKVQLIAGKCKFQEKEESFFV